MTDYTFSNSCFNNARFYRHPTVTLIDMYQGYLRVPDWKQELATKTKINIPILEGDLFWMQMMGRPQDYPEPDLAQMMRQQVRTDFTTEYHAFDRFLKDSRNFAQDKYQFVREGVEINIHKPYWQIYSKAIIRQALCDIVTKNPSEKLSEAKARDMVEAAYDHPLCWVESLQQNGFLSNQVNLWMFVTSLDPQMDHLLMARYHFPSSNWRGAAQHALPKPEISNLLLSATQLSIEGNHRDLTLVHLAAGACTHPRIKTELRALNQDADQLVTALKTGMTQNWVLMAPNDQENPVSSWPASIRHLESFGEWYSRSGGNVNIVTLPRMTMTTQDVLHEIVGRARHRETGDAVITDALQYLLTYKSAEDHVGPNMALNSKRHRAGHTPVSHALVDAGFPENLFYQWASLSQRAEIAPAAPIILPSIGQDKNMTQYQITDDAFKKALGRFTRDLTDMACQNPFPDVIGRDDELRDIMRGIDSRRRHGALITGRPGVGKSALGKAYANMIVRGLVPDSQKNIQLLEVNIESMTAGANRVGDFEQNFLDLFQGVAERNRTGAAHIVLTIPEAHTIFGAGTYDGQPIGAEQRLKKWLDDGHVKVILDVDTASFEQYIAKDEAFVRRFNRINMDEPDQQTTLSILRTDALKAEAHYGVMIPTESLEQIYRHSKRFFKKFGNPDVSLKLLDDVAGFAKLSGESVLSEQSVHRVVAQQANVSINFLTKDAKGLLWDLENRLGTQIVDQPDAIDGLIDAATVSQAGLKDDNMPIASLLFVGPTGVGKTETGLVLAEIMTGSRDNLVRIDMSEFMTIDSINKLLGTPPGFTDANRPGVLTAPVDQHPNRVVMFDEIEKAHPDVLNLLLQITDAGHLTDGKGKQIDFSNCWVIATTNVGAQDALKILRGNHMGFDVDDDQSGQKNRQKVQDTLEQSVRGYFRPEFINRMQIVPFHFLSKNATPILLERQMEKLNDKLKADYNITISLSDQAQLGLIEAGFSQEYGARPLRRTIERLLKTPLSRALLRHKPDLAPGAARHYMVHDIGADFALSEEIPSELLRLPAVAGISTAVRPRTAANTNVPKPTTPLPKQRM